VSSKNHPLGPPKGLFLLTTCHAHNIPHYKPYPITLPMSHPNTLTGPSWHPPHYPNSGPTWPNPLCAVPYIHTYKQGGYSIELYVKTIKYKKVQLILVLMDGMR